MNNINMLKCLQCHNGEAINSKPKFCRNKQIATLKKRILIILFIYMHKPHRRLLVGTSDTLDMFSVLKPNIFIIFSKCLSIIDY